MLPAARKGVAQNQAKLSAVRAAKSKAARSHIHQISANVNDDLSKKIEGQPLGESSQSGLIAVMQQQIRLQEQYIRSQSEMQQQMLALQRRQLELLESQTAKPPSFTTGMGNPSPQPQAEPPADLYHELQDGLGDAELEVWKECSGLHTIDDWVKNYKQHPAGWAALLLILGIPEVTGRVRSKVENYAIYSALFLALSFPAAFQQPSGFCEGLKDTDWECLIQMRLYGYAIIFGIISHLFSIFLAMEFVNALNETARDSDVFRLFGRGKGFIATVKCQYAYAAGVVFNFIAMLVCLHNWMGWDGPVIALCAAAVAMKIWASTVSLLFHSCSIVKYWRKELGGKPDADDPYDLHIPVKCFEEKAQLAHLWKGKVGTPRNGEEETVTDYSDSDSLTSEADTESMLLTQ